MAQMAALIEVLGIFLVIILIGFLLRRRNVVSESAKDDLNGLLMGATLPAMLVNTFIQPFDETLTRQGLLIALLAAGSLLVCFLVGLATLTFFRIEPNRQGVWLLVATFGNLGFTGFPVIEAMFGKPGLFLASFVQITYGTCFFSLGALMMTKGQTARGVNLRKIFLSPVMLAIEIGLVLYFTQFKPPVFISNTLALVGSMTGPLAMLIVGMKLSEFPLVQVVNSFSLYKLAAIRLLAAPIAVILLLRLVPATGNALLLPVLGVISAMPGPGNATNMAATYGGDTDFAAKITALSAILCLFTLPVIFLLV